MNRRTYIAPALLLIAALSGCTDNGDNAGSPSPSMSDEPLAPEVVHTTDLNACTPPAAPMNTAPILHDFEVKDGYDELIIEYHVSGEGQVNAQIRYPDENRIIWGGQSQVVNTAPEGVMCGSHGSHGDGETKTVDSGMYEVRISYTGTVAIKLSITARSSKTNDTAHPDH